MVVLHIPQKNYLPIKTVEANGLLCPCCNKTGAIEFTFYQVQYESDGNVNTTKKISISAFCKSCNADVPNLHFTKEMDAFYKAEQKNIVVKSSFKVAKMGKVGKVMLYIFLMMVLSIFLLFVWLYIYEQTKK
jgi:hypothetical protein